MISYFCLHGNNIEHSGQKTIVLSSSFTKASNGVYSYPNSMRLHIANFCSRRLLKSLWLNHDDCYIVPNLEKRG